ncbi:single-strand selective monofunctional uracil DNA glycosylase-like [Musca autumnalis]|uniref:single-strand selective monofunctional uracil DNA glycosylase-like n=1 Tax=Musca autumnalis TaxID=221902 RepID=UPI003CF07E68
MDHYKLEFLLAILSRYENECSYEVPFTTLQCLDSLEDEEEISSTRFWNLIKSIFNGETDITDRFFKNCFVHNFCPLVFVGNNGYNVSFESLAAKIPKETMTIMEEACLKTLQEQVELLQPEIIIPVGSYVYKMIRKLNYYKYRNCVLTKIPHPSAKHFVLETQWISKCNQILMEDKVFADIIQSQENENRVDFDIS